MVVVWAGKTAPAFGLVADSIVKDRITRITDGAEGGPGGAAAVGVVPAGGGEAGVWDGEFDGGMATVTDSSVLFVVVYF